MIDFCNVWKSYRLRRSDKPILRGLTLSLPKDRNIAVIGRNGAGKSTLLRLVAGTLLPDRGEIRRHGRVSWPMGFSGAFHPALTGRQNARFVARIYGVDTDRLVADVADFAELGDFLDMPFQTYSAGMRARLAFGVSLAVNFDCYLVDEITAVGDAAFQDKCRAVFRRKLDAARVIMVSHSEPTLQSFCDCALLLEAGMARFFDDLSDGLAAYRGLIARPQPA